MSANVRVRSLAVRRELEREGTIRLLLRREVYPLTPLRCNSCTNGASESNESDPMHTKLCLALSNSSSIGLSTTSTLNYGEYASDAERRR